MVNIDLKNERQINICLAYQTFVHLSVYCYSELFSLNSQLLDNKFHEIRPMALETTICSILNECI